MSESLSSPGTLVRARGREWIVLGGSDAETLRVRPVTGSEDDWTLIHLPLEREPVVPASFPAPKVEQRAGHDAALLLRDALLLSLRRGAGPFRSAGQIAVEPRAYQLVPLMMALRQDPIRLLVADDVGIGKTIEAGLIARELLDRGDIDRIAVLCPPHLVEQWVKELELRFNIHAVAVTASGAGRLERDLPPSESIFSTHPFTVVSLDYIKSETRRNGFLQACPRFVIVDEAHTCAGGGRQQRRHELLSGLAADRTRHLVLLSATPHSGDSETFHRLLALLDPEFAALADLAGEEHTQLRDRLARHFVQRRRPDIDEWKEGNLFPKRETTDLTYTLSGPWQKFFDAVLDHASTANMSYWAMLALLRCASSSPAAAVQALRTRAGLEEESDEELAGRLFDGASDDLPDDDVEPPAGGTDPTLLALIAQAEALARKGGDPKLERLAAHVEGLLADGFSPVVFCRYVATAHYVGEHLKGRLKGTTVKVITGELTSDEREERIEEFDDGPRVLVATDCLSEGMNLQEGFDAVVHYDLSWNPTRHEQREGRVDRYGQQSKVVRATLLYGANNVVDGTVLKVIIEKAREIRRVLGVPVPVPDEGHAIPRALVRAVLAERRGQQQLDLGDEPGVREVEVLWRDAAEKARRTNTVFAQRRMKPAEVVPEWQRALAAVGGREDVQRFTGRALLRLGSGLDPYRKGWKAPLAPLPADVRERLEGQDLEGTLRLSFDARPAAGCRPVHRSHPLVSVLAETLLERTLAGGDETDPAVLGRAGCWVSPQVATRTVVILLRLRHQLTTQTLGRTSTLLVEEAAAVAWGVDPAEGAAALALLVAPAAGDPPVHVRDRQVREALDLLAGRRAELDAFAERRAQALLADHRRVREAADARGSYSVRSLLPADVIGVFVLLPAVTA